MVAVNGWGGWLWLMGCFLKTQRYSKAEAACIHGIMKKLSVRADRMAATWLQQRRGQSGADLDGIRSEDGG